CVRHVESACSTTAHRLVNRSVGRAPAENEQLATVCADRDLLLGYVVGDAGNFGGPGATHLLVVLRVVRNVSGVEILFDAADSVGETGGPGDGPVAGQRGRVSEKRMKPVGIGAKAHRKARKTVDAGYPPGFGAVRQVTVSEQDDRSHVLRS